MSLRCLIWAKDQTVVTTTIRTRKIDDDHSVRVESDPKPNAQDKLVLIGIGDEGSEKSWDALIGDEDLAIFAGCTLRGVRESRDRLERAGYIKCRQTRVESGARGWNRIYLLADESPLVKGLIEVDFNTPEEIRRYDMRTFARRDESPFVPSDSPRNVKKETAGNGYPEPGSGEVDTEGATRNLVPPRTRNQVPGDQEPGSGTDQEPGSGHLYSAGSSSPSIEADDVVDQADVEVEAEREGGKEIEQQDTNPPTDAALTLITALNYGRHLRPTMAEAVELAHLVDAALASGRSLIDMRRHAQGKVNHATTNAVSYLRTGLSADRLPAPTPVDAAPTVTSSGQQVTPPSDERRQALRAGWRELAKNPAAL